jgi:hypothetical protein
MKRHSVIFTLALLGLLISAQAVQAGPATSPFAGSWTGDEPLPPTGDGSTYLLTIKGGSNIQIDFEDEFSTPCFDAGATDMWFTGALRGTASGNTLTGTYRSAKCGHMVLPGVKGTDHTWTFNSNGTSAPSDDTLSDGWVTFHRV